MNAQPTNLRLNHLKLLLVSSLSAAGLMGCVTEGRDFRSDTTWIVESRTSKDDVRLVLGEPYSVGNSSGRPTWTYGFYRYKLIGKSLQKELKLYWNPNNTVGTYSFSSSFPDDTGAVDSHKANAHAPTPGKGPDPEF